MSAILRASLAFCRAVFKDTKTMEASRAIMEITTRSSIRVNPFFSVLLFLILNAGGNIIYWQKNRGDEDSDHQAQSDNHNRFNQLHHRLQSRVNVSLIESGDG